MSQSITLFIPAASVESRKMMSKGNEMGQLVWLGVGLEIKTHTCTSSLPELR